MYANQKHHKNTLPEFAIQAKGLGKTYSGSKNLPPKHALKNIDLDVPRGAIFGLLGPNGAGKSTFINILAGLVKKTNGTAKIWGMDIDQHPRQARAAIGVVNQEINMDPFFTPFEALELVAGFYGVPKSQRRSKTILDALGLGDKANAYVRQLSGGMKRRLMVAKALVHAPPVLILDEPTAGVDVELRRSLWAYVRELHANGTTIILTTHYLEEAEELCDRIAIIGQGEIIANEPMTDLLNRLDHKTLIINPQSPLVEAPKLDERCEARLTPDGSLSINFRAAEIGIGRILEQIREKGIKIADLRTSEPHLEDVFVALTSDPASNTERVGH